MDLPVPIFKEDKIYNIIEYKKPKTGVISKSFEAIERSGAFYGMVEFLSGCIQNITSIDGEIIDNPSMIKKLVGAMPYITAETVALKILSTINKDDVIEGFYTCPLCGNQWIESYDKDLQIDTRDRISDLPITNLEEDEYINEIPVTLAEPVTFKNLKTEEIIDTVESFSIRFPTLNDCIIASRGMTKNQEVRIQMKIYIQSLVKVNDLDVKKSWIATWGQILFNELYPDDIEQIGRVLKNLGIQKTLVKTCEECGKTWDAPVNTSNFFVSGLQPE